MNETDLPQAESKHLIIWDSKKEFPKTNDTIILWSNYNEPVKENVFSIPKLIESKALFFREKYLAWIFSIGEAKINSKRVIDHLELDHGFSYWWLTWIAHKPNYYESAQIKDVIKCLAFEYLIENSLPESLELVSDNPTLAELFINYCEKKKIKFSCKILDTQVKASRSLFSRMPSIVRALLFFGFVSVRSLFSFKKVDRNWYLKVKSSIAIFDMLVYLQDRTFQEKKFYSDYWTELPDLIDKMKLTTTWVHALSIRPKRKVIRTSSVQRINSAKEAQKLMGALSEANNTQLHVLLDTGLDIVSLLNSLRNYYQLCVCAFKLRKVKIFFQPENSSFNFWHLYKKNWYSALIGFDGMKNSLHLNAFDNVLKHMPHQRIGVFIQENQPWEIALLYAWKKWGHGKIIGIPHTTIRFWDLRYFYDRRNYVTMNTHNELPHPDLIAVNGKPALKLYEECGYPIDKLREVEALRYMHLAEFDYNSRNRSQKKTVKKILICGDNIPGSNEKLMSIVSQLIRQLSSEIKFVFKPHKDSNFDTSLFFFPNLIVSNKSLAELIDQSDLVITGNITSASVDAYCRGVRVATLLDGNDLNSSPLRSLGGINYFSNEIELMSIIQSNNPCYEGRTDNYFFLDSNLKKWADLFNREV